MISLEIQSPHPLAFWRQRFRCVLSRNEDIRWYVSFVQLTNCLTSEGEVLFRKVKGRSIIKKGVMLGFEYFEKNRVNEEVSFKIFFEKAGADIEVCDQRWMIREESPRSKRHSVVCNRCGVVGHVDMKSWDGDWSVLISDSTDDWEHLLAGIVMFRCGSEIVYG